MSSNVLSSMDPSSAALREHSFALDDFGRRAITTYLRCNTDINAATYLVL